MSLLKLIILGGLAGAVYSCENSTPSVVTPASQPPTEGMVWIDGPDGGFWMDQTEVTTAQFDAFVAETDYRTEADSFGWSGVFSKEEQAWLPVEGANYKFPEGPEAEPARPNQPVTQVSYRDAMAYARWAGKRLPTEAEWMTAATQGGKYTAFPWGNEMLPGGKYLGNWWQGPFPYADEVHDGFPGIAEVRQFPPAENGLYDISGNVWEWTATDRPATGESVIKGGSFLCSTSYCTGFDLQQKQYTAKDSGLNHLGFRCIAK
ncbi:SUMF1/EgtB/PvdO family nonheme iron enzyme [Lewinella sp. JB7]|uniref:SUMF1/EgtB/PvdO family nonheme iron enzyme n=1 Tax=Lewinella sp. JB7 TaxID=2962887 RepID=UPI0020CA2350|nr:SUMF1/EgtB/PvdO family nonheme iron enzyme [Lewinella sp. JB7]MCP9235052.1 formylglycine-generating enzyme family protein [Lewinella sp. JB7]